MRSAVLRAISREDEAPAEPEQPGSAGASPSRYGLLPVRPAQLGPRRAVGGELWRPGVPELVQRRPERPGRRCRVARQGGDPLWPLLVRVAVQGIEFAGALQFEVVVERRLDGPCGRPAAPAAAPSRCRPTPAGCP